jgi:hypothetical protein
MGLGLNSGLHVCKAGALLLEPHLQSILLWLFWRWDLANYLPGLAWKHASPDLSLPSSLDYRHESQALGNIIYFLTDVYMRPSPSYHRWGHVIQPCQSECMVSLVSLIAKKANMFLLVETIKIPLGHIFLVLERFFSSLVSNT